MTEDELRLRRIQDHRRRLEAGLVDEFARRRYGLLWRDIEEIISDLRHLEDLIREKVAQSSF